MSLTDYIYPNVHSTTSGDGYETAVVVKDSAATLLYVSGLIDAGGTEVFLQVFDSDEAPTVGDYPMLSLPISPTASMAGFMEYRASLHGIRLGTGLTIVTSTSASRYVPDSSAGVFVHCLYL